MRRCQQLNPSENPGRQFSGARCQRRSLASTGSKAGDRRAQANGFRGRDDWGTFRSVLSGLRKGCPAAKPVVVRLSKLPPNILGDCARRRERFVIRVSRDLDHDAAIEVLCHEWSHALAWNFTLDRLARDPSIDKKTFDLACHDEAWGCAYSKVWRHFTVEIAPNL